MKTNIIFRGFEGLEHLRTFVQDSLENSLGRLDLGKIDEIKVIIDTTHHRRLGHPPQFLCEALMKSRNRTYFIKKTDMNFQSAVRKCVKALSKIYVGTTRSQRDKRRSIDRHQSAYTFNEMVAATA